MNLSNYKAGGIVVLPEGLKFSNNWLLSSLPAWEFPLPCLHDPCGSLPTQYILLFLISWGFPAQDLVNIVARTKWSTANSWQYMKKTAFPVTWLYWETLIYQDEILPWLHSWKGISYSLFEEGGGGKCYFNSQVVGECTWKRSPAYLFTSPVWVFAYKENQRLTFNKKDPRFPNVVPFRLGEIFPKFKILFKEQYCDIAWTWLKTMLSIHIFYLEFDISFIPMWNKLYTLSI